MTLQTLSPQEAHRLVSTGAILVDIRDRDEHAREHIPGAINVPLARIAELRTDAAPVVFHCRSGMRTEANAAALASAAKGASGHVLEGGINAWRAAGLPVECDASQPLEIMRQVQLIAGGLVVAGALLGLLVAPAFALLSAFVGAGLMLAGATGWCGMALLLRKMPWNRRARAA